MDARGVRGTRPGVPESSRGPTGPERFGQVRQAFAGPREERAGSRP